MDRLGTTFSVIMLAASELTSNNLCMTRVYIELLV